MSTKSKIELGEGVKKPVRTISGVTPLTVVLEPRKCDHGTCIYCPGGEHVPQSYTDKSPAIMRALKLEFDPFRQVMNRLTVLKKMNHPTDKIEIIVLGGTFLQYPKEYKYNFIKRCFDALNGSESEEGSRDLQEAKKLNETAEHRCIALCIENRPDNCSDKEIEEMLDFGCTRVELGVQILDDESYKKTNRGHTVQDVIDATKRLKNAGFKIGYHIMPGLPYSNPQKDLRLFKEVFSNQNFRPDQLKIYPCQVVDDSPLGKTHKIIGFKPYTRDEAKEILKAMFLMIPEYCRVMRVMREFPKEKLIDGILRLDLRKEVEEDLRENHIKINEIRMREIGFNKDVNLDLNLRIIEYDACDGKEFFLQFVNENNILFGLLRLRLPSKEGSNLPELKDCAIVRELHVYGKALDLGKNSSEGNEELNLAQHKGLGKVLMEKAEEISKENGFEKLAVISGVGVREYYKKLDYNLNKFFMIKDLI